MAKQAGNGGRRGRRSGVVSDVKRGGPGRGFWIALGVLALVGITALSWMASRPKAQVTRLDPNLPAMKAEGYLLGSPSAPVEVIEFADFECPACGQYATITEPDVRTTLVNTGKIRVRYMDYPLPMHRNTWDASLAAACANDQGKFWEMHDAIFATQDKWSGEVTSRPRGVFSDLAKTIGLDMNKYGACMDADTHRAKIQSHLAEAERRQIQSTPTFVFNGTVVAGALPYDTFKKYVDEATAAAAKAAPAGAAAGATTTTPGAGPATVTP
jgi:protein-disulfide isomerase